MQGSTTHNLKLDGLAIELDRADLEIDTDRRDVALCVPVSPREREREREREQHDDFSKLSPM